MRIKICGVTTVEDAQLAATLGADALGLNFYPASSRFITPERTRDILDSLPPFVVPVGLFVEKTMDAIERHLEGLPPLVCIQWHGKVPLQTLTPSRRWIPAFPVRDAMSLQDLDAQLRNWREQGTPPAAVLVDAHVRGEYGGTGQTAPWKLLADYELTVPLILAGGLTPENVAEAIRIVRPDAVDVASGVESAPGKKDGEKMRRFIESAREAHAKWG